MIVYWEIHVGLVTTNGPGKGLWSYGVKGWCHGETKPPKNNWSGLADNEVEAWKAVERLKKEIRGDWP